MKIKLLTINFEENDYVVLLMFWMLQTRMTIFLAWWCVMNTIFSGGQLSCHVLVYLHRLWIWLCSDKAAFLKSCHLSWALWFVDPDILLNKEDVNCVLNVRAHLHWYWNMSAKRVHFFLLSRQGNEWQHLNQSEYAMLLVTQSRHSHDEVVARFTRNTNSALIYYKKNPCL